MAELRREDYASGLLIVSKRGKKAWAATPDFQVLGKPSGWWCYQYREQKGRSRIVKGFLLRFEEFKDWRIAP